jgi:hypothetical protein
MAIVYKNGINVSPPTITFWESPAADVGGIFFLRHFITSR